MNTSLRAALILGFISACLCAQDENFSIEATKRGQVAELSVRAAQVSAHEVILRVAETLQILPRIQAEGLEKLRNSRVDIEVKAMPATDLVEHLLGSIGLRGGIEEGELRVLTWQEPNTEAGKTERRLAAIEAHDQSGAIGDDGAAFKIGLLHFAGGEFRKAIDRLRVFIEARSLDPRALTARLVAGQAALRLGSLEEGRDLLSGIERDFPDSPRIMTAQLLLARTHLQMGAAAEALVRLDRIIHDGADERMRAVALLQRAELFYLSGLGAEATEAMARIDIDIQRKYADIAMKVPLFMGLCLELAKKPREAIPHLELALLTDTNPCRRARAGVALFSIYLDLGDLATAVLAGETAINLNPEGALKIRTLQLRADLYARLGIVNEALSAYDGILELVPGADPVAIQSLRAMAELLFRERRFKDARDIFSVLARRSDLVILATLQVARCELEVNQPDSALASLARLEMALSDDDKRERAHLRGQAYLLLGDTNRAALAFQGVEVLR